MTLERTIFMIIIFVLVCVIMADRREMKILQENLDHYRSTYLHKSGASAKFGSYRLFSNDAGKHWYVIEDGKIVGLAEDVRPGLLEHILAFDALFEYVKQNGPITLNDDQGLKVLENAGFEIIQESEGKSVQTESD